MKKVSMLFCVCAALLVSACATSNAGNGEWKCEAPNLIRSYYSGGEYAFINLFGYYPGNNYEVVKVNDSLVTGITGNGTPFKCTRVR